MRKTNITKSVELLQAEADLLAAGMSQDKIDELYAENLERLIKSSAPRWARRSAARTLAKLKANSPATDRPSTLGGVVKAALRVSR